MPYLLLVWGRMMTMPEMGEPATMSEQTPLERLAAAEALQIQAAAAEALAVAFGRIADALDRITAAEERRAAKKRNQNNGPHSERDGLTSSRPVPSVSSNRKAPGRAMATEGELKTRGRR